MANEERRLPIKVVIPQEHDLTAPQAGGSERKVFGKVSEISRAQLRSQLAGVRKYFGTALQGKLPVVARVVLKKEALAKSHRPYHLFAADQCPIIGGQALGTLLVSVRPDTMDRLEQTIVSGKAPDITADMSTIDHIEPFTADHASWPLNLGELERLAKAEKLNRLKVRLFLHRNENIDALVLKGFSDLLNSMGVALVKETAYASSVRVFVLQDVAPSNVPRLARFVGTQNLGPVPSFDLLAQYIPQGKVTSANIPAPVDNRKYPLVGLIDSGTDPANPLLQAWVIDRDEEDIPRADQDNNHGSFVAGLVVNARGLNHANQLFPDAQAKLIDVVAMPKAGTMCEDDLLRTIRRAVSKYPDVRVWNLSISKTSSVCQNDAFSDFAQTLDEIQEREGVTFVICAGNFQVPPLRGWPPEDIGDADRIHPPADSVLGVAVGSLAHLDHAKSRVKKGEPSPFSRRGPGAAYILKPDVCHYGGNCTADGDHRQIGLLSVDGNGNISEGVGTSFSTPIVSSVLANIQAGVIDRISPNLAKALLVHSAALVSEPVLGHELRYRGFGVPSEVGSILTCTPWQATLIFDLVLPPHRKIFSKPDFPIPPCFRNSDGDVEGDFLMTLVYDPLRDVAAGAEYCRTNIDVSLGTYDVGAKGKPEHHGMIPLEPKDYSKLYEKHLVQHGFKWSPVKVYRQSLAGTRGKRWRLHLRLLYRGMADVIQPQRLALVVTMFDRAHKKPVYDEVVRAMAQSNWVTADLRVDQRIRLRS